MDTLDFAQLMQNLSEKFTPKEISELSGVPAKKIRELQDAFENTQALLNLHLDACPEYHNQRELFKTL